MSLADDLTLSTSAAWNSVHADSWTILGPNNGGETFTGDAQTESPMMIDGALGDDSREKILLYCFRPGPPLNRGTRIQGRGSRWVVVDREDNPVNSRIKFEIQKLVDGKDP